MSVLKSTLSHTPLKYSWLIELGNWSKHVHHISNLGSDVPLLWEFSDNSNVWQLFISSNGVWPIFVLVIPTVFVWCFGAIERCWFQTSWPTVYECSAFLQVICTVILVPVLIAVGVLLAWHIYLLIHNRTTIEVLYLKIYPFPKYWHVWCWYLKFKLIWK